MTGPVWRRRALLACLAILGVAYACATFVFVSRSRDFIATARDTAAFDFAAAHPLAAPVRIAFGGNSNDGRLGSGWQAPEAAGTWSDGTDAQFFVVLRACDAGVALNLDIGAYVSRRIPRNRIALFVNDVLVEGSDRTSRDAWQPLRAVVPATIAGAGNLRVRLHADHAGSPFREGTGEDRRVLGFMLKSLDLSCVASSGS